MIRILLTLSVAACLSAVTIGQAPAPLPSASDQLQMLEKNRTLLEQLLNSGIELSNAENTLDRVEASHSAVQALSSALTTAAKDDPKGTDRIDELADHLGTVWEKGFAPNVQEARTNVLPGSPEFERLEKLEAESTAEMEDLTRSLESAPASIRAKLEKLRPLPPRSPSEP